MQGTAGALVEEGVSSEHGVVQGDADAQDVKAKKISGHEGHGVIEGITDAQLEDPTSLLNPIDDRKSQAVRFSGLLMHGMMSL